MHGLMQDWPLRVGRILDHAARQHPRRRVVSRSQEGTVAASDYASVRTRALRAAQALARLGLGRGDAVGVMAWNTLRMLEAWYAVPGAGAVLHTINPRLFEDEIAYIAGHAEDRALIVDPDLAPLAARLLPRLPSVRHVVVLTDAAHMPAELPQAIPYESLLESADGDFDWVAGDERDACGLCYTSGTTGHPKGVAYTHRSNVLHAMATIAPDMLGLGAREVMMPVVPLFHANGWSTAYAAPMAGAGLVLPGRALDAPSLYDMLERGVTITAAVPVVWLALLAHLDEHGLALSTLRRVVIGGSSCPRAVIERFQSRYGVEVLHAWGMTEMSPLGTVCTPVPETADLGAEARLDVQETVGRAPFTVDLRIVGPDRMELPWDGRTAGTLEARGAAVLARYHKAERPAAGPDGWFDTGDVATIDENGFVRITDRVKDIIKSGGEWISSIDLENAALAHPDVAEAAAVGIAHPMWGERPLLVVRLRTGAAPDREAIRGVLAGRFASWQLPDDILFVDDIPHTATGKISKRALRDRLREQGFAWPT
jgi:fatty-acyl-CoA synthase